MTAASRGQIRAWFNQAVVDNCTHMIVATDTFDWDDYPVYCESEEVARERFKELTEGDNMQKVMEVYKIDLGWEAQATGRVHNW